MCSARCRVAFPSLINFTPRGEAEITFQPGAVFCTTHIYLFSLSLRFSPRGAYMCVHARAARPFSPFPLSLGGFFIFLSFGGFFFAVDELMRSYPGFEHFNSTQTILTRDTYPNFNDATFSRKVSRGVYKVIYVRRWYMHASRVAPIDELWELLHGQYTAASCQGCAALGFFVFFFFFFFKVWGSFFSVLLKNCSVFPLSL